MTIAILAWIAGCADPPPAVVLDLSVSEREADDRSESAVPGIPAGRWRLIGEDCGASELRLPPAGRLTDERLLGTIGYVAGQPIVGCSDGAGIRQATDWVEGPDFDLFGLWFSVDAVADVVVRECPTGGVFRARCTVRVPGWSGSHEVTLVRVGPAEDCAAWAVEPYDMFDESDTAY